MLLLLGAAAGIVWYLLSSGRYATYQIQTNDSASGLIADAPVEYHGADVGKVKSVELIDSRSIRILLSIRNDAPVTAATVATIIARGLDIRTKARTSIESEQFPQRLASAMFVDNRGRSRVEKYHENLRRG